MNNDTRLIFEDYAKSLNVAVADSSAGLPVAKKPLDEEEDFPISNKKLIKKVANFPLLMHYFTDEIEADLYSAIEEIPMEGEPGEYDPDDIVGGIDDPEVVDNRAKWNEVFTGDGEGQAPATHTGLIGTGKVATLVREFINDLSSKLAKEYIKREVPKSAKKYERDSYPDEKGRKSMVNAESMTFLPGGDAYVTDHIMRTAVPREIAPEKPEGRKIDYMWKEIAEYDPKKIYWNPSARERADREISNIFEELFGEGLSWHHLVDVLLSGFESPEKLLTGLIKNPNITKIRDLFRRYDQWFQLQKKKHIKRGTREGEDFKEIKNYGDGYRWVQLVTKAACQYQGAMQDHCVGQYDPTSTDTRIFSLIDKEGYPHVTLQVGERITLANRTHQRSGEDVIHQIKGKKNSRPSEKYQKYILDFIENKEGYPDAEFSIDSGVHRAGKAGPFRPETGIAPGRIAVTHDGQNIGWEWDDDLEEFVPKEGVIKFTDFYKDE